MGASLWGPLWGSPLCAGSFTVGTKALTNLPERDRPAKDGRLPRMPRGDPSSGSCSSRYHNGNLGLLLRPISLPTTNAAQLTRIQTSPSSPESPPSFPFTSLCLPPRSFSKHPPLHPHGPRPGLSAGGMASRISSRWPLCLQPLQTCLRVAHRGIVPKHNLYPVTSLLKTFRGSLFPWR